MECIFDLHNPVATVIVVAVIVAVIVVVIVVVSPDVAVIAVTVAVTVAIAVVPVDRSGDKIVEFVDDCSIVEVVHMVKDSHLNVVEEVHTVYVGSVLP